MPTEVKLYTDFHVIFQIKMQIRLLWDTFYTDRMYNSLKKKKKNFLFWIIGTSQAVYHRWLYFMNFDFQSENILL